MTALMWAVDGGHKSIVEAFLKHKADVNIKDKNGYTALRRANNIGHSEIAQLLKNAGATK